MARPVADAGLILGSSILIAMDPSSDLPAQLRSAIRQSPDNGILRRLLGDALFERQDFAGAEAEYRRALALQGGVEAQTGLARAFAAQGKYSEALVVAETLVEEQPGQAAHRVVLARLLLASGDARRAAEEYRRAVSQDAAAADPDLAERLGERPQEPPEVPAGYEQEEVVEGRVRARVEEDPEAPEELDLEDPGIDFRNVGGMDGVKEQIRMKIVLPMQRPDLFKSYGKKVGGGILLYGPPGCGKTLLARATAGEVDASFLSIGIHDVLDMWIGASEQKLHAIFEGARANTPCVLFFDEVDALGASRSDMRRSASRMTVNQFLSELDGVAGDNDGLLVLAATNTPWHLDSAFRRPGRFDRIIFVPPPDEPARAEVLRVLLAGKPVGEVDFAKLAKKTKDFSGADLQAVVDRAVESRLADALRSGIPEPVTTRDLLKAAKTVRPSTKEWFATARNHALYANQSGLYDDILRYLKIES